MKVHCLLYWASGKLKGPGGGGGLNLFSRLPPPWGSKGRRPMVPLFCTPL